MTTRTFLDDLFEYGVKGKFYTHAPKFLEDKAFVYFPIRFESTYRGTIIYSKNFDLNGNFIEADSRVGRTLDECFRDFQTSENIRDLIYDKNPELRPSRGGSGTGNIPVLG